MVPRHISDQLGVSRLLETAKRRTMPLNPQTTSVPAHVYPPLTTRPPTLMSASLFWRFFRCLPLRLDRPSDENGNTQLNTPSNVGTHFFHDNLLSFPGSSNNSHSSSG